MIRGQRAWIRIRGTPDDPESFDLANWNGIAWEVPRTNSLGETIYLQIPDYLVVETLPPWVDPRDIYHRE